LRALVTGGVGFIGTNLIKRLLSGGHKVVSLDNYTTGKKENEQKGCQYFKVDLVETDDYSFFMSKPDVIFHLAATPRIQPSFKNPVYTFYSNVVATLNVLEWARDKGYSVVYAGSSSSNGDVYANPYTFTKWQGEELVKMYNWLYKVPAAICRFYNVYGPHQLTEGEYCTLIGIFESLYKEGKPLTITGDGEQRRDFTHVDDIVDGIIRCGNALLDEGSSMVSGEIFELGRGKNYSVNEIADAFGENYPTKYINEKPGEMRETLCIDTHALRILRWNPKKDVIDFIKENYSLNR
jgi:UDP-glucose 4-epimerase